MKPTKHLLIFDNTTWPYPDLEEELIYKLNTCPDQINKRDAFILRDMCEAYCTLITHPAFTLDVVKKKVSGIRKAVKEANDEQTNKGTNC